MFVTSLILGCVLQEEINCVVSIKTINKIKVRCLINSAGMGNLFKQEQAREWGQLVFKSVLTTAGRTVLDNPSKFLSTGTGSGASEMVTSVGNSLLSSILEDVDAGNGVVVSLKNVFTTDTLSKVTQASFEVLAQNPEWYDIDNEGLKDSTSTTIVAIINEAQSEFFTAIVAPNPASSVAQVHIEKNGIDVIGVQLFDIKGKLVNTFMPQNIETSDGFAIPIGILSNQTYILKLYLTNGESIDLKLLIQN